MPRSASTRKALALVSVFILGVVLGAAGYALLGRQPKTETETVFSIDPDNVNFIIITGRGPVAMPDSKTATIFNRDQIEHIAGLLNRLPYESKEVHRYGSGFSENLYTLDIQTYGGRYFMYFDSTPDGDRLTICDRADTATTYRLPAGYFGELPKMESCPEHPGPTAQPEQP